MSYKQLLPANDWHYILFRSEQSKPPIVFPVAVWALREDGTVIGLLGDLMMGGNAAVSDCIRLVEPSASMAGMYKHRSTMTEQEAQAISNPVI